MSISQGRRLLWNVPYQRNPFFTGREETLRQLHDMLQADNAVALSHPLGISGLGGVGKTQAALEYAYRYRGEYEAVFWTGADSVTTLIAGFVELASLLELPECTEQDQNIIVEAVLRWLRLHTGWLFIFDNLDDLAVASPFVPKAGPGHILFTTRAHALGGIAQRLEVQQMQPETGALLLLRRASLLPLQSFLSEAPHEDRRVACEISQELDGLPLALDQAGAYIKETPCLLGDYLDLYRTHRQDLLHARGSTDSAYPASVATTWSLSFRRVAQANPAAATLLELCSFLAPDRIPEELFRDGMPFWPASLQQAVMNPLLFQTLMAELLKFSLVKRLAEERTISIHRLMQAVQKDQIEVEKQHQWAEWTVRAINTGFPDNLRDTATWPQCLRYLDQAQVCCALIEHYGLVFVEAASVLTRMSVYLHYRALYAIAEPLSQRALVMYEQQLGATYPEMALCLNNLALLYKDQGKYAEAEPLLQRALVMCEQQLGATYPETVLCLSNLALLYKNQGKYAEAEQLLLRGLAIAEQHWDATHPYIANILTNVALFYKDRGKYAEAESLLQRALSIHEKQLGTDHPRTAGVRNNLAVLYQARGKYAEAELLLQQALATYENQVGADHPSIAQGLNNLAEIYRCQGKYAEAEPLYQRALAMYEQRLGATHPGLISMLTNVALFYQARGKYAEAESLLQRALAITEQQVGTTHSEETAHSLNGLAMFYCRQKRYAEAETLLKRALAITERQIGVNHPKTQIIRAHYAYVSLRLGRWIGWRGMLDLFRR